MKQVSKKRMRVLIIAGVLFLAAVGVTIASYTSIREFNNKFSVGISGVAIKERFDPTDQWLPGEQKEKKVWFTNTGQQDMLLRFSVDVKDPLQNSEVSLTPEQIANVFQLYWSNSTGEGALDETASAPLDFIVLTGSDGKTYYYYQKILKANDNVHVLHSVKFNSNLSNDDHISLNYSENTIELSINGEMVLADEEAAETNWLSGNGINVAINESTGKVTWTRQR